MADSRKQKRDAYLEWMGKMVECVENLPPDERAEFDQWDLQRPEGVGTSNWPGFEKHLPPRPWDHKPVAARG